ncbi:hypothetical protein TNCV_3802031 [Trichonephila clavipes]|nr:hypothetical protein TNCV_3802031 [Trichonephila clavipes]
MTERQNKKEKKEHGEDMYPTQNPVPENAELKSESTNYWRLTMARGATTTRPPEEGTFTFKRSQEAAVAEWYRYRTVACFVTGSSPVPLKDPPCRAAMHVKSVES